MIRKALSAYVLIPLSVAAIVGLILFAQSGNWRSAEMRQFRSEQYGLEFAYPDNYNLEERVTNKAQRYHVEEVLIDSNWQPPKDGEGPTAITFGVYQNNLDRLTAEQWIKGNNISNYKLSDGNLIPVEVSGVKGFMYHWDGLYPAEEIVVAKGNNIYYIIMTYIDFSDKIILDFERILPTVKLL